MPALTGPARYLFLRREHGPEEVPNWPPEIRPLERAQNLVAGMVRLTIESVGWRAEPIAEAGVQPDATPETFWLTRDTVFGLSPEERPQAQKRAPRRSTRERAENFALALLAVRTINLEDKGLEYATHLVVRIVSGKGWNLPKGPFLVPIEAVVIGGYVEYENRAEYYLNLRLKPAMLSTLPVYLPDATIERLAEQALDRAVPTPRARHEILVEVEAGRVSLHGRVELNSTGEAARAELERTPGVVEVADYLLYDEELVELVSQALAAKGLDYISVFSEHNLIVLHGVVPDRKTLYIARDTALKIPGVRGVVINQLLVEPPSATTEPAAETAPSSGTRLPSANDAPRPSSSPEPTTAPSRQQPSGKSRQQRPKQQGDLAKSR